MSKFEDRLWSELVLDHGPELASLTRVEVPRHSRRGPVAVGAVALAGAIAAVAITASTGTSPSVAYAVSQSSDGDVTVSIRELTGVSGANAQLAKLKVRARVETVEATCAETGVIVKIPHAIVSHLVSHEGASLVIDPSLIPQGDTLAIAASPLGDAVGLSYELYRGAAPSCVGAGASHVG